MEFHFYWIAILFLAMLLIPNAIWVAVKDKELPADKENKILVGFEKVGQVCCIAFSLFSLSNHRSILWLLTGFLVLCLYEVWWIRYFKSKRTLKDLYSSLLGVPFAGATLPVIAFLLLAIYENNPLLAAGVIFLGIGHIGIFYQHSKVLKQHP